MMSLPLRGRWHGTLRISECARDGRSLRDKIHLFFSKIFRFFRLRTLPHPTLSGAPSRREPLVLFILPIMFF